MARFLQFKAVQRIYPEWDVDNQFLTLYEIPVMYDDGFRTSQPVSVEVNSPAEINSLFSSITYDKGSSVLRMLESTVGPDNFREGLNVPK
jgi:aminopeptidase N